MPAQMLRAALPKYGIAKKFLKSLNLMCQLCLEFYVLSATTVRLCS